MSTQENKQYRKAACWFSILLHLALFLSVLWGIRHPFHPVRKPRVIRVALASPKQGARPASAPPAKPAPVKPMPKAPAVAKPTPEKPAPPKPAPAKPAPAKPVPEKQTPTKPAPAKPAPANPAPTKPVPKKNTQQQTSLQERLQKARQQQGKNPPKQPASPKKTNLDHQMQEILRQSDHPSPVPVLAASQMEGERADYAEQIVRPYIYAHWKQPSRSELKSQRVSSVVIRFTVLSNGSILSKKIETPSNSSVMNRSVQEFLGKMTRLDPPSKIGSKASSLEIVVTMGLE